MNARMRKQFEEDMGFYYDLMMRALVMHDYETYRKYAKESNELFEEGCKKMGRTEADRIVDKSTSC